MSTPTVEKTNIVVYIDGLGREHPALVASVNGLHLGRLTVVFIDPNAPERENVQSVFDVPHVSMIEEPNPELPNYQVNCWKAEYESHRPLPSDHPAFDHPFLEPEYDEQGNRILPERPQTEAEIAAHQSSKPAAINLQSSDVPSAEDLDAMAEEQKAANATAGTAEPDVTSMLDAAPPAPVESVPPPVAEEGQTE